MESYRQRIADEVARIVEPVLIESGLELVEVQFRQEQVGLVLRIVIYRKDGVGIDDCARVSREVGHLLDVEDLIAEKYHLEVSSPGLDRPLKTEKDFIRALGEMITLKVDDSAGQGITHCGVVTDVRNGVVSIQTQAGSLAFPLTDIKKARREIEF
ncbi:MAG: ribosome maturation factor RimP [Thermodesulfobacteriota bacterium]